jgi:hydrocephalus-inducing protein
VNELLPLNGNNEGTFEVEYRPLAPTSQPLEHLLTIITKELGTFKYKVVVRSTPPVLRQTLRFDVPLGAMQTEYFMFHCYNTAKCDFACSVKRADVFAVQKVFPVDAVTHGWDGDDVRLPIVFEPTVIGEVRDLLTVSSADGGEYICELIANCTAPLPQGPFNITQGGPACDVSFRNCFDATCTWLFSVDSSAFRLGATTASVNAKTQSTVAVFFEPKEEHMGAPGGFLTAKLFVTCTSKPGTPPWVFYLRGKIDANAAAAPVKGKK